MKQQYVYGLAAFLAIVGLSVSIDRVEAKQKLSANRDESDRSGVVDGLSKTREAPARMIELMVRGVCERHPDLKFVLAEFNAGWIAH